MLNHKLKNIKPNNSSIFQSTFFLEKGFTLIELMIVVTIVAILVSIALPSYNESVKRARRAEARSALMQAAQWMERAATAKGSYPLTAEFPTSLATVNGNYYTIALASADGISYTLTAPPQGVQATDKCGTFTLDQTGLRGVTGTTETVTNCWNR